MRAESVAGGFVNGSVSLISAAFFDEFISLDFDPQQFKKINLINPTKDTVYVNMLADVLWDSIHYCDFMDIRIPPKENCKLLVPVDTKYNLYFSNTIQNDDDQLMQINTDDVKQVMIKPSDNALSRK